MKTKKGMTTKKLRFRNFLISFLFVLAAFLTVFLFWTQCRVKTVAVSPTNYVAKEAVIAAAGIPANEHLYAVNKGKIERAVQSSHPYIKSVTVKRSLPNTVRIEVKEYIISYRFDYENAIYLLADDLTVIDRFPMGSDVPYPITKITLPKLKEPKRKKGEEPKPIELPLFKKPVFEEKNDGAWVMDRISEINGFLFKNSITELYLDDPFDLHFRISDKYTVLLGNERNMTSKLSRVTDALFYLDENIHGIAGILHATEDSPVSFEITGVSDKN